ncbi:MAG: magnetochrome domain-containing protein [Magnetococcales bacterium]|nr:magnetochrome domain-containing protein [Magnetococcales bacterium]
MKNIAEWIMAAGVVFSIGLLLLTIIPDNPWNDHVYNNVPPIVAGVASPHKNGRQMMVCSSCHEVMQIDGTGQTRAIPPVIEGTPNPHPDARGQQNCGRCHKMISRQQIATLHQLRQAPASIPVALTPGLPPASTSLLDPESHERFQVVRFQGKVRHVYWKSPRVTLDNQEGVIILVDDGVNEPVWLDLGPRGNLEQQGCGVQVGTYIKGTAFQEASVQVAQMQYAKTLAIHGQFCTLRDNHLRSWTPGLDSDEE